MNPAAVVLFLFASSQQGQLAGTGPTVFRVKPITAEPMQSVRVVSLQASPSTEGSLNIRMVRSI